MPTVQKVHIDKALTNISIGYSNEQYIADLAQKYAEENKISIKDATKVMYEKYSERGDE